MGFDQNEFYRNNVPKAPAHHLIDTFVFVGVKRRTVIFLTITKTDVYSSDLLWSFYTLADFFQDATKFNFYYCFDKKNKSLFLRCVTRDLSEFP